MRNAAAWERGDSGLAAVRVTRLPATALLSAALGLLLSSP